MKIQPILTPIFHLGDHLEDFVLQALKKHHFEEKSILVVTSKIVSLSENRIELMSHWKNKEDLVKREADHYLGKGAYDTHLTIKENLFIASAGIDSSNAEGDYYILYPDSPFKSAKNLYKALKKHFNLSQFGVLLTDSHTQPLRRGVTGVALSYWGFKGVKNMVGQKDLFGRTLKMTSINSADALATAASFTMGEGSESNPLAIIKDVSICFHTDVNESDRETLSIPLKEDLYYPLFKKSFSKNIIN